MTSKIILLLAMSLCSFSSLLAQTIQLRNGTVLAGKILAATGDGLQFKRLDNEGVLDLQWSHLTSRSALQIKTMKGLLVGDASEIQVEADVLVYMPAQGQLHEAVGRIIGETEDVIQLRRKGIVLPIKRSTIRVRSRRQVAPAEIFAKNEFYQEELTRFAPGEDADKHIGLGDHLMRARDYENASLHLQKAETLGGGRQPAQLQAKLKRLANLQESAAESLLLDEARVLQARQEFKRAEAKLLEFEEKYADSKIYADFVRQKARFEADRDKHLMGKVVIRWYQLVHEVAERRASDMKLGLADARQYAETQMGLDIREQIAGRLEIEVSQVDEYWGQRHQHSGVTKSQRYYYSLGSWVLGADAILKGTRQGEAENKQKAGQSKSAEQKKLDQGVKRIQEALRRAQQARGGKAGAAKMVSDEEWWLAAPRASRTSWLKAYYAEHSGDLKMVNAYVEACSNCAGKGSVEEQGSTGSIRRSTCSLCQGTRMKRNFRAE